MNTRPHQFRLGAVRPRHRLTASGMTKEIGFDNPSTSFADPLDLDVKERLPHHARVAIRARPAPSSASPGVAVGLNRLQPQRAALPTLETAARQVTLDPRLRVPRRRNVLLVLGEYIWRKQVIPPAEQWQTGVAQTCASWASTRRGSACKIALELEPFKLSLVNDVDSMVRFSLDEREPPPAVQANIDNFRTLQLSRVPAEDLRRLRGKAIHVHLSDCDGQGAWRSCRRAAGVGAVSRRTCVRSKALGIDGAVQHRVGVLAANRRRSWEWVRRGRIRRPTKAHASGRGCAG